jgi:catechol 2,3-dioxygenase-like lactoylglutathione lyase family enzyme
MKVSFVAGFGPIAPDVDASYGFYHEGLGIDFEGDREYWHTDDVEGVKAFAVWPLSAAAESCFGRREWPADLPVPQAWLEFDVESPAAVDASVEELERKGYRMLVPARVEPWGQTVARVLGPEGILVGIAYTPWMHSPPGTPSPGATEAGAAAQPGGPKPL